MKKLKFLLVILAAFLVLPFSVFADEADDTTEKSQVNLYFFHGDGCPHCEEASAWFEEIEDEYGDYFNLVSYEVWYNQENANLMSQVADARSETVDGVPYIVVGDQSWSGFAEDYEDSILAKITEEYEKDESERYDVMSFLGIDVDTGSGEGSTARDVFVLLLLLIVVGGIIGGVAVARKKTN